MISKIYSWLQKKFCKCSDSFPNKKYELLDYNVILNEKELKRSETPAMNYFDRPKRKVIDSKENTRLRKMGDDIPSHGTPVTDDIGTWNKT